jgi:hypothetical protein
MMSRSKNYTEELLAAIQEARAKAVTIERDVSEIKRRILSGNGTETFVSLADISNVTKDELAKQGWFISADGSVLVYERPVVQPVVTDSREPAAKRNFALVSKEVTADKDNADTLLDAKKRLELLILQRDSCKTDAEKACVTEKIEKLEQLIALL